MILLNSFSRNYFYKLFVYFQICKMIIKCIYLTWQTKHLCFLFAGRAEMVIILRITFLGAQEQVINIRFIPQVMCLRIVTGWRNQFRAFSSTNLRRREREDAAEKKIRRQEKPGGDRR